MRGPRHLPALATLLAVFCLPALAAEPPRLRCGQAAGGTAQSFCSVTCNGETRRQSCGNGEVCECSCAPRPECRCRQAGEDAGRAWLPTGLPGPAR